MGAGGAFAALFLVMGGYKILATRVAGGFAGTPNERQLLDRALKAESGLAEANKRIVVLEGVVELLMGRLPQTGATSPRATDIARHRWVLAVFGPDVDLELDLNAFRKVRQQTGLAFTRLTDVTKDKLTRLLNRERMNGTAVKYIHFAVHANAEGLEFADGVADALWLGEILVGVQAIMMDACKSEEVGDLVRSVPFVVTLLEEIDHQSAMLFAEAFWVEIGRGRDPEDAYYTALTRCPPDVSEFAQIHVWG